MAIGGELKVLVCGGRDFKDLNLLSNTLWAIAYDYGNIGQIIHGGAMGADTLAGQWAYSTKTDCRVFRADWNKFGKRAGYIRNVQMLQAGKPDLVVAMPGGKGTAMMVRLAKEANVHTIEVHNGGWAETNQS